MVEDGNLDVDVFWSMRSPYCYISLDRCLEFQKRYHLNLHSVHFEPYEYPDGRSWRSLARILRNHDASWMLWEGTPRPETVVSLEDLGVKSVVFDPCGNRPESGDYFSIMKINQDNLRKVFSESTDP